LPEGQGGVVSLSEAKHLAAEANMDLVEVSPNADPPVCKIMDYDALKQVHTNFFVRHFSTTKAHGNLGFISFFQKLD
jgi:hypothetical protein